MTVLLSSTCAHLNINGILSLLLNKVSNIFPNIFISRFQNKPTNLPNLMYQSYTIHSDNLNRTSNFHLRQSFALQTCNLQYPVKTIQDLFDCKLKKFFSTSIPAHSCRFLFAAQRRIILQCYFSWFFLSPTTHLLVPVLHPFYSAAQNIAHKVHNYCNKANSTKPTPKGNENKPKENFIVI